MPFSCPANDSFLLIQMDPLDPLGRHIRLRLIRKDAEKVPYVRGIWDEKPRLV